jgi:hypothetical protein
MTADVVALRGGLGNQLFQAAFAGWIESRTGRRPLFDISARRSSLDILRVPSLGDEVRSRLLMSSRYWPAVGGRMAGAARLIRTLHGPRTIHCDDTAWGPSSPDLTRPAWWFGYFQRERYAHDVAAQLLSALSPQEDELVGVGVHVRRADMVGKPTEVPPNWFRIAVEMAAAEVVTSRVRVWSDDPAWCRAHLDLGRPFELAAPGSPLDHLATMSRCRALIISRSTFSWWAARLAWARGARVYVPSPWWDSPLGADEIAVPDSWTRVPVTFANGDSPQAGLLR